MNRFKTALVVVAFALPAVALSVVTAQERVAKAEPDTVTCVTDSECYAMSGEFVLIGQGCGPDLEVMVAREEDQFPASGCQTIDRHWLED